VDCEPGAAAGFAIDCGAADFRRGSGSARAALPFPGVCLCRAAASALIQNTPHNLRKFSEFLPMMRPSSLARAGQASTNHMGKRAGTTDAGQGSKFADSGNDAGVNALFCIRVEEGRGAGDAIRR
jgi:hypothetical protein